MPPRTAGLVLSEEELAEMFAEAADLSDLGRGPLPAVLDTNFVRTGLQD